jgi:heme o synthase
VTTMYVAGDPSIGLVALTCLGGYLSAGGAGAVNHWYDRDIDAQMARTADRPVASGRVSPRAALIYGLALAALAFVVLSVGVNPLAAVLSLSGFLGYTLVYTVWLKRSTPQNIVIGGAAGAFPPMIGWAVATGGVAPESVAMFALIFLWTPPHFWALALFRNDDYTRAGVPMLPVTAGDRSTRNHILGYALVLAPIAVAPAFSAIGGPVYLAGALVLNLLFVRGAWRIWRRDAAAAAADRFRVEKRFFGFSIVYLTLHFTMLLAEAGLRAAGATPAGWQVWF